MNARTLSRYAEPARIKPRIAAWAHCRHGHMTVPVGRSLTHCTVGPKPTLANLLCHLPPHVERLWLVGDPPWSTRAELLSWAYSPAVRALYQDAGSYLDPAAPVLRYNAREGAQEPREGFEVRRMDSWYGDGETTVNEAQVAWDLLESEVRREFGKHMALLASPGRTGLALWDAVRTGDYPGVDPEIQGILHDEMGQGRIEYFPQAKEELPGLWYYDRRFTYAYHVGKLGIAPGHRVWFNAKLPYLVSEVWQRAQWLPGIYRVRWYPPESWRGPGLLPVKREGGEGWFYPATLGRSAPPFQGWVDAVELKLALAHGWAPMVDEAIYWQSTDRSYGIPERARPLDTWADKIKRLWAGAQAKASEERVWELVQQGLRSILLFGLGSFASQGRTVTRICLAGDEHTLPVEDDRAMATLSKLHPELGLRTYEQWMDRPAHESRYNHPEWAQQVWARARARVMWPTGKCDEPTGALAVPKENLVAILTDALLLSTNPGWEDDGRIGTFRLKAVSGKAVAAPRDLEECYEAIRRMRG